MILFAIGCKIIDSRKFIFNTVVTIYLYSSTYVLAYTVTTT